MIRKVKEEICVDNKKREYFIKFLVFLRCFFNALQQNPLAFSKESKS